MLVCDQREGAFLRYRNAAMQLTFDKILTKSTGIFPRNASMRTRTGKSLMSLLQRGENGAQPMTAATAKVPMTSRQVLEFVDLECGPISDCGRLYDTLSLAWGGYEERVDECCYAGSRACAFRTACAPAYHHSPHSPHHSVFFDTPRLKEPPPPYEYRTLYDSIH